MQKPSTSPLLASLLLVLACAGAQAQGVYRIVGPDGKVTFSDRPPADANAQPARVGAEAPSATNGELPFALRQVASRFPVTLYTGADCAPCTAARNLLTSRGVPFRTHGHQQRRHRRTATAEWREQPAFWHHRVPAARGFFGNRMGAVPGRCRLSQAIAAASELSPAGANAAGCRQSRGARRIGSGRCVHVRTTARCSATPAHATTSERRPFAQQSGGHTVLEAR